MSIFGVGLQLLEEVFIRDAQAVAPPKPADQQQPPSPVCVKESLELYRVGRSQYCITKGQAQMASVLTGIWKFFSVEMFKPSKNPDPPCSFGNRICLN